MNIENAFDYLNNANREIKTLRARVYAYEQETKQIEAVRSRLSKTEQRMLQAFQAFHARHQQLVRLVQACALHVRC